MSDGFNLCPMYYIFTQVNVALICRTRNVLDNIKTSVCHITIYPALVCVNFLGMTQVPR
ncbi:hypothetical protein FVEG_17232 [Fusarium verticillioides 7600]|uniref:Uncharacterized protein n=1 Tax=Gibberella moniliformis (strain M3125 / FGSC 7600) TaxID=334819 RepID=W7MRH9_GIBM7|nr:hypothetical protein FVEG_17232 [Fusarium verticillioides 7600]EWG54053.1 hypothetical protein FVEG_17232 [Fusarium verticillioides 7600]